MRTHSFPRIFADFGTASMKVLLLQAIWSSVHIRWRALVPAQPGRSHPLEFRERRHELPGACASGRTAGGPGPTVAGGPRRAPGPGDRRQPAGAERRPALPDCRRGLSATALVGLARCTRSNSRRGPLRIGPAPHNSGCICEKYRALLADVHDGLIDLPETTARRDSLMREVQNVYEHALPGRPRGVSNRPRGARRRERRAVRSGHRSAPARLAPPAARVSPDINVSGLQCRAIDVILVRQWLLLPAATDRGAARVGAGAALLSLRHVVLIIRIGGSVVVEPEAS